VLVIAVALSSWIGTSIGGERGMIFVGSLLAGLVIGYLYSAPPFKLKKNIFFSGPAVGFSYGFITYLSANALFSDIRPEVLWLAGLNFFMAIALIVMNDFKSQEGDAKGGMKSLTVMIGAKNTFLVAFIIIDLVFAVFAWLAWDWARSNPQITQFPILVYCVVVGLVLNIIVQIPIYRDPKSGITLVQHAVDDGFGNAIGKSEVQEHNAFLRFQVVNNILFLTNQMFAAALVGIKYM